MTLDYWLILSMLSSSLSSQVSWRSTYTNRSSTTHSLYTLLQSSALHWNKTLANSAGGCIFQSHCIFQSLFIWLLGSFRYDQMFPSLWNVFLPSFLFYFLKAKVCIYVYVLVCIYTFFKGYLAIVLLPFGKLILQRQGSINAGGGEKQMTEAGKTGPSPG